MKLIYSIFAIILFASCSSTISTKYNSSYTLDNLNQIIVNKGFEIQSDAAYPTNTSTLNQLSNTNLFNNGSSASRISLIGNSNFLKVENDSVSAYLPFYGERRLGAGYGDDGGIKFEGIPEDYTVEEHTKKKKMTIKFEISEKSETYNVFITLFTNGNANISVNSSQRTSMSYQGNMKEIVDKKPL